MAFAAVTGLAAEARILARRGVRAEPGGGIEAAAEALCARLLAEGAEALMSFGIAGALAPDLAPGALLLPHRVRDERGETWTADEAWRARVLAGLRQAADERDLLGRAAIAATAEEKAALHSGSSAVAIDLESHVVARAARRAGRPFLVLRAVADPAGLALPPAAIVGLDRHGRVALLAVLRSLAARPQQIGALLRLAGATRAALQSLAHAAGAL